MGIKHLVLCGGGENGFTTLGVLTKTHDLGIWNIDDIETIYCSSSGSFIGCLLCLKYSFKELNEYILKRSYKFFKLDSNKIISLIKDHGIYDESNILKVFKPLLLAKELSVDITFRELYEYSGIELNLITTNLGTFCSEKLSYKTTPELRVITGLYMSANIPILFKPVTYNDNYYIDGGIFSSFPLKSCVNDISCNKDEILGVENKVEKPNITMIQGFITYILYILIIFFYNFNKIEHTGYNYIYNFKSKKLTDQSWIDMMDYSYRKNLFDEGINFVIKKYNLPLNDISNTDISNTDILTLDMSHNTINDISNIVIRNTDVLN